MSELERELIIPPPSNNPPGLLDNFPSIRKGGSASGQGVDVTDFQSRLLEHLDKSDRFLSLLLARFEQGQLLPELKTLGFLTAVTGWGSAAVPNVIIPPQAGNSIYVVGLWWSSTAAINVAFGQGTSTGDAEFFPSALGLNPAIPVAVNGGFSMTAGRPNWVFRTDPGKGLMCNLSGAATLSGYASYFVADVSKERPADLS